MSSLVVDQRAIKAALSRLDHLSVDEYIFAFGAHGQVFHATIDGYYATCLPERILIAILTGLVRKIVWASFGSNPDSWFFAYEPHSGNRTWACGSKVPRALSLFFECEGTTPFTASEIRVQLGRNDDFVCWDDKIWICYNITDSLFECLRKLSVAPQRQDLLTTGSFRGRTSVPDNIAWHRDGTYYLHSPRHHSWHFETSAIVTQWVRLWGMNTIEEFDALAEDACREIHSDLAYVTINPHTETSDHFVFVRKHVSGLVPPRKDNDPAGVLGFCIVHLGEDDHTEWLPTTRPAESEIDGPDAVETAASRFDSETLGPEPVRAPHSGPQLTRPKPAQKTSNQSPAVQPPRPQWAEAHCNGRPHPHDTYELFLKKGEFLEILHDAGRDWFIAKNKHGERGYVHRSWLEFTNFKPQAGSHYVVFMDDMKSLILPGQLRSFPPISDYINICGRGACASAKEDTRVDMCIHNLEALLRSSGQYSHEWLKETRNMWHPDKFARYCHPDHKQELQLAAQEMFVMYGILMDECKAGSAGRRK